MPTEGLYIFLLSTNIVDIKKAIKLNNITNAIKWIIFAELPEWKIPDILNL